MEKVIALVLTIAVQVRPDEHVSYIMTLDEVSFHFEY